MAASFWRFAAHVLDPWALDTPQSADALLTGESDSDTLSEYCDDLAFIHVKCCVR